MNQASHTLSTQGLGLYAILSSSGVVCISVGLRRSPQLQAAVSGCCSVIRRPPHTVRKLRCELSPTVWASRNQPIGMGLCPARGAPNPNP